jgi:hypothetical protein
MGRELYCPPAIGAHLGASDDTADGAQSASQPLTSPPYARAMAVHSTPEHSPQSAFPAVLEMQEPDKAGAAAPAAVALYACLGSAEATAARQADEQTGCALALGAIDASAEVRSPFLTLALPAGSCSGVERAWQERAVRYVSPHMFRLAPGRFSE